MYIYTLGGHGVKVDISVVLATQFQSYSTDNM